MPLSRATLPEEFFDTTSAMLLTQPEPQYPYATLFKNALNAALNVEDGIGLNIPGRAIQSKPGAADYAQPEDGRLALNVDPISAEAITVVPEIGKGPGHTVRVNRPKFANTTYTEAARTVAAGTTISVVPIEVGSEQTSLTLKRYAGPYDTTNTRVAPYSIDRFDASVGSLHKLTQITGLHLKRDFDRTIDAFLVGLFDSVATANIVYPQGATAVSSTVFSAANLYPCDYETISRAETVLDIANIPYFADGFRMAFLTPTQLQHLKNDAQFARYATYHKEINPILSPMYFSTIGKTHIFRSNTLSQTSNGVVAVQYGHMFGPGKIGCGMGEMPRVMPNSADNYGETALVIWLMYAAFTNLDNRFGCSIRTGGPAV